MADALHGRVGDGYQSPGQQSLARLGRSLDIITNLKGKWAELVKDGKVFMGSTAVAGVAPGTAIGTTAAFALANSTDTIDCVLLALFMEYVSGTLGIGVVDIIAHDNPAQAAISGTAITPVNAYLGGPASLISPFTTATVPASGKIMRPLVNLPPMLATSVLQPWIFRDDVEGSIIIAPRTALSLQATAAGGSTPLVRYGAVWAEVQK